MALNASLLAVQIIGQLASKGIIGTGIPSFSQAFSDGLITAFVANNKVTTTDTGVITIGTGTGKMIGLVPSVLSVLVQGYTLSKGIFGTGAPSLADAVSQSVVQHFLAFNNVTTTHSGIAVGTGTGKVTGITANSLTQSILGQMASKGVAGPEIKDFVSAFSEGFAAHMNTATVQVVIIGIPSPLIIAAPIPGIGTGQGKVT